MLLRLLRSNVRGLTQFLGQLLPDIVDGPVWWNDDRHQFRTHASHATQIVESVLRLEAALLHLKFLGHGASSPVAATRPSSILPAA